MLPAINQEQEIDDDPMAIPFYPFGEVLVKNKTRRKLTSDYVYGALFYIVMLALAFAVIYNDIYLYQPKSNNHAKCTNHEISSAPLAWIPQALASMIVGQTIAWATLYFSCGTLHRFPPLALTLDVATLAITLPFTYRPCVNSGRDHWGFLLVAILQVVASFFSLPTIRRLVARLRATLARVLGLMGIWRNIVAYGARYWARQPQRRIALGENNNCGPEVEREREPCTISCAQALDTETSAETYEEFEDYRARNYRRFVTRSLAWTTFLRLMFLSWFFADRIINLSNYDGFFDHYVLAVSFIMGLSVVAGVLRFSAYNENRGKHRDVRSPRVEVPIEIL